MQRRIVIRAILIASLGLAGCAAAMQAPVSETLERDRRDAAGATAEMERFDQEIDQVMSTTSGMCDRACELTERLCALSDRICGLASRHEGDDELRGYCTDGAARCRRDRERVAAASCDCASD
jgi:hypothetical protein